ncbi:MAG: VOC family protein [Chloroflexota bacterium]|nr:VOC family protein [Chloroflexota bacterium]
MAHPICHFEIPADDVERARKFYQGLFGWQIAEAGEGYHLIQTGEGELGGGMMKRVMPEQRPVLYVLVESVDEYAKKIQGAGGTIVVPKMAVPTMGYFAQALDTEGNVFAIWEANAEAK